MAPPGPRYRAGPQTKRGARAAGDSNDEEIMKHAKKHADDLIEMLATAIEAQSAPWQKPWKCDARLPTNLITGKVYTGRNLLMLATVRALKAYNDHRWAGFQQIKSAGGHVRRGERGHWICIMRTVGAARAAGQNDVDLDQESDGSLSGPGRRRTTRGYTYTTFRPVWNASQSENIAPLEEAEATDEGKRRRILAGEAYLAGTPARVDIRRRNDACYRSRSDEVLLPRREQFDEPVGFYQTALHELAHATEQESRLDRHLDENRFGSAQYIREELVAEVPAFLASTNADLGHSPGVLPAGDRPRARLEDGPKSCLTYIYSGAPVASVTCRRGELRHHAGAEPPDRERGQEAHRPLNAETPKPGRDHAGDLNRLTLRTATSSRSPERRAANGRPGPGRARRRDPDPVTGPVRARQQRLTR